MNRITKKPAETGQNLIEYIILFVAVVVVLVVFLNPAGFFATTLDSVLGQSFEHVNHIAHEANRYNN